MAQDAAGSYKLTGVDVLYTFITRSDNTLTVTDTHGMNLTIPVATIPAAMPFSTQAMQLNDAALSAVGINLNVVLNEDGSGEVAEGSYYPDINTIEDENGACVTLQQVLPVSDPFEYTSMGNMMATVGMYHPGVNVLGLPGISPMTGQQLGGLELSDADTFEDFPMFPEHPTLCDPTGTDCFPFTIGDIDESGTLEIYPDVNLMGIPEYVPGGAPLAGLTAGYWLKEGVNTDEISSIFPGNTDPDFHLEWHAVDGADSGLGWGDDADSDEDGDGTWFDRIIGIPSITVTFMNPACGFNMPIYGDVSDIFEGTDCVDGVGSAASGYLMDPALITWGSFMTGNAAQFNGCLASTGGDMAFCASTYPQYLADDSDHDYNGVDGRLTMNFDIPCIGVIEAREVVAEFIDVENDCVVGDLSDPPDGTTNISDVIILVQIVLSFGYSCEGDMNGDGGVNVLDIVDLVALALCIAEGDCNPRVDEATSATFEVIGNEVTMTANGYVGAVQMTLSHGKNFQIDLTDNALVANYSTNSTTTTLIVVVPEDDALFTTNDDFTIESVLAAANSESYMDTRVVVPGDFTISAAYPNPLNPTTQMTLALHTQADVSVKVFNMMGQLVDVITEGQMGRGTYSLTWDGTNASSGVYFVKTEVGSVVHNQKIMLIK